MSDANGVFTNPTLLVTSEPGAITSTPGTLNFSLPTTTAGEGYKIRVKSIGPVGNSSNSNAFAAYYKIQDSPFTINNLIATGAFCTGSSYVLKIDNPGGELNDSPLKYASLTYKWYKETSPTTSVFISDGQTLSVNQPGTYFVKTNYGTCTSNSFSNRVKVSEVGSGATSAEIVSSLGNPFCSADGMTTLTTIDGSSYQWFFNGDIIPGATQREYKTKEGGTYTVQVSLGACSASGSIELDSQDFESSIDVDALIVIESGEVVTATVTTTAVDPQFKWYLNDVLIVGAETASYEASQFGDYKAVVTQSSGCKASQELLFTVKESIDLFPEVDKIPNLISPNGDGVNDTWIIPKKYVSGTNTEITIISAQGKVVFETKEYLNNWPEGPMNLGSINQVFYYIITTQDKQIKKGSITVVK